ncbi:MAG TPA: NAD(P)H-dependent glycerol-3-phosphate dehydrogenase [Acidimicrobiales bacterium]|nr:NAD(P)H-dependent glycerol-3-phosphate dehydrogenase [Acidimicrobiales bacterium]
MSMRVAVIGAGSWGTTVAAIASKNGPTTLWARKQDVADEVNAQHTNESYLPEALLPPELRATADLAEAVHDADVVVMAVPSHGFRDVLADAVPHVRAWVPVVSLSKGLEQGTSKRMTEVVNDLLPEHPAGVLTGPNLAKEIMGGQPAASVVAMADDRIADGLQPVFAAPAFRVYTNLDIVGCEVAGALKNVMAIAAGMAFGMGFGDNTKATLMTRGLAELTRLGVAMGGDPLTFSGLAGMGDLVATCMSPQSRNHRVGLELGKGRSVEEIVSEMNMVAEGVKTSRVVCDLARQLGVEMPIAEQVDAVCHRGVSAQDALLSLMARPSRAEHHGLTRR